jgi:hypothetical protein
MSVSRLFLFFQSQTHIFQTNYFLKKKSSNENFLEETLDNVGVLISVPEEMLLREYGCVTVFLNVYGGKFD